MVKFLQNMTSAFVFSCGWVMGEQNGDWLNRDVELEVDETALLQSVQSPFFGHASGDMAALKSELAAIEGNLPLFKQRLVAALVPLAKVEVGTITTMDTTKSTVKDQFVTHTFVRPFAAVPVVVAVIGSAANQPAEVRIFDVTKEEFKVTVVEPEGRYSSGGYSDGPHRSERVDFMAVVPGVHELYGLRVEAGLTSTNATVTNSKAFGASKRRMWETLGWNFSSTPALFVSLNSINNDKDCFESGKHISSPWMTAATKRVSKKGAKISIEQSEVADGAVVAEEEDIAWIAVQQGTPMGAEVVLKKKMGTEGSLGFGDAEKGKKACLTTKEADPICVVSKSSRFGNNGGWTRVLERKENKICVVIDEDMKKNKERHHVQEDISMIAFPKAFSTCDTRRDLHLEGEMTPRDTPGWNTKAVTLGTSYGYTCASYARYFCVNGVDTLEGGMQYDYPADNCVACGKGKVPQSCCTNDCIRIKAIADQKAIAVASTEKWIVGRKTRILNLEKALQEQLRKTECAAAFPGKKKIGQLPADMSSLLETFEDVYTFTDCRLRCCIPAESSLSVACASVIYDADAATCFTMSDAYVNPLKGVAGPPIFAAAYERNRGTEAAS